MATGHKTVSAEGLAIILPADSTLPSTVARRLRVLLNYTWTTRTAILLGLLVGVLAGFGYI